MRRKRHNHPHFHIDGSVHQHEHSHNDHHLHVHEKSNVTPWILFTIFIFGPCEPLIPIVMYPAAKNNISQLVMVTFAFSLVTILTMLAIVIISYFGFKLIPVKPMEKYAHILAGTTILLCGFGMVFLGL